MHQNTDLRMFCSPIKKDSFFLFDSMVSDLFLSLQQFFLHLLLFFFLGGVWCASSSCPLTLAFFVGCLGGGIYLLVLGVGPFSCQQPIHPYIVFSIPRSYWSMMILYKSETITLFAINTSIISAQEVSIVFLFCWRCMLGSDASWPHLLYRQFCCNYRTSTNNWLLVPVFFGFSASEDQWWLAHQ